MTDDLLAALTAALAAPEPDRQWLTVREIQVQTGLERQRVYALLHQLADGGRLETGQVMRANLAGVVHGVPAYRLKQ